MIRFFLYPALFTLSLLLTYGESGEMIDQYLKGQIRVDYPYPHTSGQEYFIFAADKDTPQQLIQILNDPSRKLSWPKAIHALGTLSSDPRNEIELDTIYAIVENLESSPVLSEDERLRYVERGYWALAYYGTKLSFELLKQRTRKEFWEGKAMPTGVRKMPGLPEIEFNARSKAIEAISSHPLEIAEEYLSEISKDPEYYSDKVLKRALESASEMRSTWLNSHQKRIRAFEAKRELERESNESIVEIPATSSEAVDATKVIEKATADEPATEEPSEVVTLEPTEEPFEQSSNWWLWLIGVVIVVSGVGLVLLRKN